MRGDGPSASGWWPVNEVGEWIIHYKSCEMFKDLICLVNKDVKERGGKWRLYGERDMGGWLGADRFSIGPDGHIFNFDIDCANVDGCVKVCAVVIGGERVANKYRVEIRLSSCEKEFSITHWASLLC